MFKIYGFAAKRVEDRLDVTDDLAVARIVARSFENSGLLARIYRHATNRRGDFEETLVT